MRTHQRKRHFVRHQCGRNIGRRTGFDQHHGSSIDARQKGPHAHAVVISPDNRFLFVPDLGLDKIFIYRLNPAKATFEPNNPAYVSVNPGLGPRHFAFGAGANFAYLVCEWDRALSLSRTITRPGRSRCCKPSPLCLRDFPELTIRRRFRYTRRGGFYTLPIAATIASRYFGSIRKTEG